MSGHHHRSLYKHENKPFKGKSKGKAKKFGKVENTRVSIKAARMMGKTDRHNQAKQLQQTKREALQMTLRGLGTAKGPPKTVGIVSLGEKVDVPAILSLVTGELPGPTCGTNPLIQTFTSADSKINFQVYSSPRDILSVMDIGKVADILLFVVQPRVAQGRTPEADDVCVDALGYRFLDVLKAQGLPTSFGLIQGLATMPAKKKNVIKKIASRFFETELPDCKILQIDTPTDCKQLVRFVNDTKLKQINWRHTRAHVLAESVWYTDEKADDNVTLHVSGFLRGNPSLHADHLVHITGVGDFQLSHIHGLEEAASAPGTAVSPPGFRASLISQATEKRTSLLSLEEPDFNAEQSIITDEELSMAKFSTAPAEEVEEVKSVWDEIQLSDEDDDGDDDAMDDEEEKAARAKAANREEADKAASLDPIKAAELRREREREEIDFPDEIDLHPDTIGSKRFQKYRGLKSWKSSPWDPKENLPQEYGRITQFHDFGQSCKYAKEVSTSADHAFDPTMAAGSSSQRVSISLVSVPRASAKTLVQQQSPVLLWGLLSHERKVSVCHYNIQRMSDYDEPVKMKDQLEFHCGPRRFNARPIYSVANKKSTTKQLVQRFLLPGRFTTASIYAPMLFPPFPVLMFKKGSELPAAEGTTVAFGGDGMEDDEDQGGEDSNSGMCGRRLVATGTSVGVDPDKLLVKRVILTGRPISCNKRNAIVRHMFYNPDDIRWFKPIELRTRYGLVGRVIEPRGTKGYMKCSFDGFIANHDVVYMNLYKRQYPPFDLAALESNLSS